MLHVIDAGILAYRPAWELQLRLHEQVLDGTYPQGALILLEHPPVITVGRRTDAQKNLLASPKMLAARGVELVETDRGGDITFHGPGQLVAYPIIPLNAYNLNLHAYMRLLEQVVIDTLTKFNITAHRDPPPCSATGVWVTPPTASAATADRSDENTPRPTAPSAKIAAIGIKVRRWTTLHGLALNVCTDLAFFDLINPCGLSRPVTSMQRLLGGRMLSMGAVKESLINAFNQRFALSLEGVLKPIHDAYRNSGMTEDQLGELIVKAKKDMHAERRPE